MEIPSLTLSAPSSARSGQVSSANESGVGILTTTSGTGLSIAVVVLAAVLYFWKVRK